MLGAVANRVAWSMFDVTVVAVVVGAVVMVMVRVRGARGLARKRRWWNAAFDVVALAGAVYLVFMTTWGWHYRRMPLATRLDVRAEGLTSARVRELADTATYHLNSLHAAANKTPWPAAQHVAWAGYDSYLKSNRVREGLDSYDGVVTLMARARFDEHWRPAVTR